MNTNKLICYLLIIIFFTIGSATIAIPQDTGVKKSYEEELKNFKRKNFFQISVFGGPIYPIKDFRDKFGASAAAGLDFLYRINEEASVSLRIIDHILTRNSAYRPDGNYLEFTLGPKFYFCPRCYRSSIFFEVGVGPVLMNETDFTDTLGVYRGSRSIIKLAASTGIGGEIVVSNSIFFIVRTNVHTIFSSNENITFISALGGFTFRF